MKRPSKTKQKVVHRNTKQNEFNTSKSKKVTTKQKKGNEKSGFNAIIMLRHTDSDIYDVNTFFALFQTNVE